MKQASRRAIKQEARGKLAREVADAARQQVREEWGREAGRHVHATREFWVEELAKAEEQQRRGMSWQAAIEAQEVEQDASAMESAQKVVDDYGAMEAHWTTAVYKANAIGVKDVNQASVAQQMANE